MILNLHGSVTFWVVTLARRCLEENANAGRVRNHGAGCAAATSGDAADAAAGVTAGVAAFTAENGDREIE